MDIRLHNTLTNKKEFFTPIDPDKVLMYSCGPTLYDRQHIGNLSMFVFTDVLKRTLEYAGLKVKQVINFTDFGHLSGDNEDDADAGEDRMTKGLKREGLELTMPNMRKLAEKYAQVFLDDLKLLNIKTKDIIFPYASDYIKDQIKLVEKLEEKGFTYQGSGGIYFDTSQFPNYDKLGQLKLDGQEEGARVALDKSKRHPQDFLLWKTDGKVGWKSPWGVGFPGWHIECSAMIIKILGEQIDIHTGGIEHIGVHHNNEIAQSESATGKSPFSRFWLHRAHLKIDDTKISKSIGNVVYLSDLSKYRIHPLSLRYFLLSSHYQTPTNFTWEAVSGAQNVLERLACRHLELPKKDSSDEEVMSDFKKVLGDNLNTSQALAILSKAKSKHAIDEMNKVLGLNIKELSSELFSDIPYEIMEMKEERDIARQEKNWQRSDELREEIEKAGFVLEDSDNTSKIRKTLAGLVKRN